MCLFLHKDFEQRDYPYTGGQLKNGNRVRWKLVHFEKNQLSGPFKMGFKYTRRKGQWNVAELKNSSGIALPKPNAGFHVFTSKRAAVRYFVDPVGHPQYIARIEVSGHLQSGHFGADRSETWERFRFLEIYKVTTTFKRYGRKTFRKYSYEKVWGR